MPKTYVLAVLISLTLGLVGPHPCPMTPAPPAASEGACHETQERESSDAGDCDAACKAACQASMVLPSALSANGVLAPALGTPRFVDVRTLPLVADAIDHIPLA